ncbi:MAG: hypothetical protein ACRDYD_04350, partial [Acidimicrobiales bacterium]
RALFSSDPADLVMAVRGAPAPSRPATGALPGRVRRLAGGAAISVAAAYLGLNLVADAAVAHGLDTVKVDHYGNEVFVAIRLGPASVGDAQVTALLGGEGVTAVLSGRLVREDASAVRQMSFDGVDLADGGWGRPSTLHVVQPSSGVISSLHAFHQVLGKAPIDLVPPRAVNGIDLVSALVEHVPIVRAVHELTPAQVGPPGQSGTVPLRARAIYVIDASTSNGAAVTATLWRLQAAAAAAHLATAPLVDAG